MMKLYCMVCPSDMTLGFHPTPKGVSRAVQHLVGEHGLDITTATSAVANALESARRPTS